MHLLSKVTFRDPWTMMMMKIMVAGMVVAAGESLRMTSSGQPFACEDRARATAEAATESTCQQIFTQPSTRPHFTSQSDICKFHVFECSPSMKEESHHLQVASTIEKLL